MWDDGSQHRKLSHPSRTLSMEVDVVKKLTSAIGQRVRPGRGEERVITEETHDPNGPSVVARKYSCIGGSGGNVHGNCAEGWFDHIWNDRPYCSDRKFWCEWGGGVFTKE